MTVVELNHIAAEICSISSNAQASKVAPWNPVENMNQAILVVEHFPYYNLGRANKENPYYCEIYAEVDSVGYLGAAYEKSLPLAITKASVAARLRKETGREQLVD